MVYYRYKVVWQILRVYTSSLTESSIPILLSPSLLAVTILLLISCLFYILHVSRIMFLSLYIWFISLRIIALSLIHCCMLKNLFFLLANTFIVCTYHICFIPSSVYWYAGWVQHLAIVNSALMSIRLLISISTDLKSFGQIPRSEVSGLYDSSWHRFVVRSSKSTGIKAKIDKWDYINWKASIQKRN
jgi:hypothetical protein